MGYYERKATAALITAIGALLLVCLVAVGPYLLGKHLGGIALGWTFEIIYLGLAGWLAVATVSKSHRRAAQLATYRTQMAISGQAWFDPVVRHYRHGTCSIRHRSIGAAQRCKGTI